MPGFIYVQLHLLGGTLSMTVRRRQPSVIPSVAMQSGWMNVKQKSSWLLTPFIGASSRVNLRCTALHGFRL